jgi:hypothetical protein
MINIFASLLLILVLSSNVSLAQNHWQTHYEQSGGLETPRYVETKRYSKMLADSSKLVSFVDYGVSPQGRALFALVLDKSGLTDPNEIRKAGRVVFFIEACIHPGEPEGKDAGLRFFRDVAIRGMHLALLNHVSVVFVPIVNPDGHERFGPYNRINQNGPKEMGWRTTATNLNMNRDFLKADAPEMAALLRLFNHWLPDFFMDIHTTNGADYQYVITYAVEDFGNLDPGLTRWLQDAYVPDMEKGMATAGSPVFPYVSFMQWHDPRSGLRTPVSTPRYSVGYVCARNRPGILVETHMLKPYQPRVEATLELIVQTARLLHRDRLKLAQLNRNADLYCTSGALLDEPFALTYKLTQTHIPINFEGYKYHVMKSELTGAEWFRYTDTPQTYVLQWYRDNVPDVLVSLPEYYFIPAEWSDIIQRLQHHGVSIRTLPHDTTLEVLIYRFSEVKFADQPYEGRTRLAGFQQEEIRRRVTFPPGSVMVPMRQQAARLIAHALEPSSPESFLQWGYFNAIFERKEYAEGYVIEKMAPKMFASDPELYTAFQEFSRSIPDGPGKMWAVYLWLYSKTPWWDEWKDVYPVARTL